MDAPLPLEAALLSNFAVCPRCALCPAVFDFDFTTADGQKLHKMIFLNW